jgi:hypothetical protein
MTCLPLQLGVLEHQKKDREHCKERCPLCLSWLRAPSLSAYRDKFFHLVSKGYAFFSKPNSLLRSVGSALSAIAIISRRSPIQCLASAPGLPKEAAPSVFCKTHGEKLFLFVYTSSPIRFSRQPYFPPSTSCNLFKHLPWLPRASIGC